MPNEGHIPNLGWSTKDSTLIKAKALKTGQLTYELFAVLVYSGVLRHRHGHAYAYIK